MEKSDKMRVLSDGMNTEHGVVREVNFEQRPERRSDVIGRVLQAEGTASANALRQDRSSGVYGTVDVLQ